MSLHGTHRTVTVIYSDLEGVFSALEQYAEAREEERLLVDEGIPEGASQADFTRVLKAVTSSQDLLLEEYLKSRNQINKLSLELCDNSTVKASEITKVKAQSRLLIAALEPVVGTLELVRHHQMAIVEEEKRHPNWEVGPNAYELHRDVSRAQEAVSSEYKTARPVLLAAMKELTAAAHD